MEYEWREEKSIARMVRKECPSVFILERKTFEKQEKAI